MIRYIFSVLTLLVGVSAQAQTQALSLFEVPFSFELPQGWRLAEQEVRGDMTSAEFVPATDSLNEWGALICVQSFRLATNGTTPEEFLDGLAQQYQQSCQGDSSYEKLGETQIDGQRGYHAILACSKMPALHKSLENQPSFVSEPAGEAGYYSVFQRPGQLMLLHKSMRMEVFSSGNVPVTPSNYQEFIAPMLPLRLQ
ncbi:hypothetical protein [Shewanella sp.]|uniref:hypothetical protein n=1 Tax=Shewanella sp. TaxID=50422 RepID=UPI003568695F